MKQNIQIRFNLRPYLQVLFIAMVFISCTAIKEPVFNGINDLNLTKMEMAATTLSLHLNYYNPNRTGLRLKNAEGEAWIEDTFLGHFKMDSSIKISGHSDFIVPVKLDVDMKNAMKNAAALLFKTEVVFKIDGKAKIGKGGVYLNYPIRYEGKQDPSKLFQ